MRFIFWVSFKPPAKKGPLKEQLPAVPCEDSVFAQELARGPVFFWGWGGLRFGACGHLEGTLGVGLFPERSHLRSQSLNSHALGNKLLAPQLAHAYAHSLDSHSLDKLGMLGSPWPKAMDFGRPRLGSFQGGFWRVAGWLGIPPTDLLSRFGQLPDSTFREARLAVFLPAGGESLQSAGVASRDVRK